jgi:hypothetical protein
MPDGFDDSGWAVCSGQPGGIGFGRGGDFTLHITSNVQSKMDNINATCLVRIPFYCPIGPEGISVLSLGIQYDGGFVAYINGQEVARRNFPQDQEPAWDSHATDERLDSQAMSFQQINITSYKYLLVTGKNLLAIHAMNSSAQDKDFLTNAELLADITLLPLAPGVQVYSGPIVIQRTTSVMARSLKDRGISGLSKAIFSVGPVRESVRITELMYNPPMDQDLEFIELANIADQAVDLAYVSLSGAVRFVFAPIILGPHQRLVLAKDPNRIQALLADKTMILGPYSGALPNKSGDLMLADALGQSIQSIHYEDWWYPITDGKGFSLTAIDPCKPSGPQDWRPSALYGGSPGIDDTDLVIPPGSVVINEVMSNPPEGQPDWIELHNTTDHPIEIGGWYLSDDEDELTKYRIPEGSVIGPHDYLVLYADRSFGKAFGLAAAGEQVYLTAGLDGKGIGYCDYASFGPSEQGISLGRYTDPDGRPILIPLEQPTPGQTNAPYAAGPIIISEIMARPYPAPDACYIELANVSDQIVSLYDEDTGLAWALGIESDTPIDQTTLPSDPPLVLRPGACLVVTRDRRIFESRFQISPRTLIVECDGLKLTDTKRLRLLRPTIFGGGQVQWLQVDQAPIISTSPDLSLHRTSTSYGADPANWQHTSPSPGVYPG